MHEPFLCDLVEPVVNLMGDAFPELCDSREYGKRNTERVTEMIREEEASFLKTLDRGIRLFDKIAEPLERLHADLKRQLEPIRLTADPLLKALRQAEEPLQHALESERQRQEAIHRQLEPIRLAEKRMREVLAPLQRMGEVARRALAPIVEAGAELQDALKADFDRMETMRQQLREPIEKLTKYVENLRLPIDGISVFKLHDTYGFPIDLTEQMAKERGLGVEVSEYERLMEEARERSRVSTISEITGIPEKHLTTKTDDSFKYSDSEGPIEARYLFATGVTADGMDQWVGSGLIGLGFDRTCFYGEQGGQVGDRGEIQRKSGMILHVVDTVRSGKMVIHMVDDLKRAKGDPLRTDEVMTLSVDKDSRRPTEQNHTATHILNWALREVLELAGGGKVDQKGSLVDPEKTRFDFTHNKPLTDQELERIENLCREKIASGLPVYAASREEDFVDQEEALEINTLRAVFGEKYPEKVRVVSIGAPITEEDAKKAGSSDWLLKSPKNDEWMKYSVEFCGGTHVANTSEIEAFTLTHEEGVAKGIRRLVGISGDAAKQAIELGRTLLAEVEALITEPRASACANVGNADLASALASLQQRLTDAVIPILIRRKILTLMTELQKTAKEQAKEAAVESADAVMDAVRELFKTADTVGGVTTVVGEVPASGAEALRSAIDWVRNKTDSSAMFLASVSGAKVTLIAGMSKSVVKKGVKAGDLIKEVAPLVGGRGGGRPGMAQGGGDKPEGVGEAIERAKRWIGERV